MRLSATMSLAGASLLGMVKTAVPRQFEVPLNINGELLTVTFDDSTDQDFGAVAHEVGAATVYAHRTRYH